MREVALLFFCNGKTAAALEEEELGLVGCDDTPADEEDEELEGRERWWWRLDFLCELFLCEEVVRGGGGAMFDSCKECTERKTQRRESNTEGENSTEEIEEEDTIRRQ